MTTPNSDVLYAMSYVDMGETGPIVLEAPPGLQGILLDFWQRPIPVDGGKFLVLPPGYRGEAPKGYYVYRSGTNNLFVFLRGFYEDPNHLAPAIAHLEKTKIYPLNLPRAQRKPMRFPDASGVSANMLPRSDVQAFEQLKWLVDKEGQHLAGPDGLGMLAGVGLVAGRPFELDAARRGLLNAAAKTGYDTSRKVGFMPGVGGVDFHVWKDRQWVNPVNNLSEPGPQKSIGLDFRNKAKGYYDVERRFWFFTNYYSISPGMVSQIPGRGAAYAICFNDADGAPLVGHSAYKLTLPANIPAELFWSVTLYEAANGSGLATDQRRFPSLGSRDKPPKNADGSTDLYIGPEAPQGKEANWLPTAPQRGFFAILRLYGPTQAAIDFSWKPGDLERLR